jgi:uridine kinase
MERLLATLARTPARTGATRVLAIDGRSGAGKSSFAAKLAGRAGAPLVSLEDLYGGWDGLRDGIERLREQVLAPLARNQTARVPRYDWRAAAWLEPWPLRPPAILIVEGVGAGARALAPHTSLLVWIELDEAARARRVAQRRPGDLSEWARWARLEDAYLARERPQDRADVVLGARGIAEAGEPRLG